MSRAQLEGKEMKFFIITNFEGTPRAVFKETDLKAAIANLIGGDGDDIFIIASEKGLIVKNLEEIDFKDLLSKA